VTGGDLGAATSLRETVERLVELDPHQMSAEEYLYAARLLADRHGCNALVFGLGNDSQLWRSANQGGRTAFIEDSASWVNVVRWRIPEIEVHLVRYGTRRAQWREMLASEPETLALRLPPSLAAERWDVILVDGPAGHDDECPGRMRSIGTAALFARRHGGADVILHDCDRAVERAFCERFFATDELVRIFDRTRHYRIKPAQ
jgi:uncharacterized protein (TIGR01627 family)